MKIIDAKKLFYENNIEVCYFNFEGKINKEGKLVKKTLPCVIYKDGEKKGWGDLTNEDYYKKELYNEWSNGIAIKTGKINNITVVDIDTKDENIIKKILEYLELENLEQTPCIETNKGYHLYFEYNEKVLTTSDLRPDLFGIKSVDIRNDGSIIYAPPTKYEAEGQKAEYKPYGEQTMETFIDDIKGCGLIQKIPQKFIDIQGNINVQSQNNNLKISFEKSKTENNNKNILNFDTTKIKEKELTEEHKRLINLVNPDSEKITYVMACIIKRLGYSFEVLEEWASKSEYYDKNTFYDWVMPKWKNAEKYNYNIGTLRHYAKECNPDEFRKHQTILHKEIIEDFLKNATETDLAILFTKIHENIVCIDEKKGFFMIPNKFNKWELHKKPTISKLLSFETEKIMVDYLFNEINKKDILKKEIELAQTQIKNPELDANQIKIIQDNIDKNTKDIESLSEKIDFLNDMKKTLRTKNKKSNYISEISDLTFNEKITEKFDEVNPYLLNFENGSYDLKSGDFRYPEVDEYITKSTGYDFKPTIDEDIRKELFDIMNIIYKQEDGKTDVRDYVLKIVASCLCGYNKFEAFYVFNGFGGNGKGLLDTLYKRVFGEYYSVISSEFFTQTKQSSSTATPEIADKKGVRMLMSSECKKNEEFQSSTLKKLSGNDEISARKLYHNQEHYKPQFTMFFQTNGFPNLSEVDRGIKRRFNLIDHPVQFKPDPNPKNFYEEKMDSSIKEKFSEDIRYRQQFVLILIEYYNKYIKDNTTGIIEPPPSVKEQTSMFLKDNDVITQFFDEIEIEITSIKTDKMESTNLYDSFKDSQTKKYFNDKTISKQTFYKLVQNHEGITKVRNNKGYIFTGIKYTDEKIKKMKEQTF
jgi:P4 family phage/plasmid primase-like protien